MARQKLAYINDEKVWKHISGKDNFSAWVRDCALAEMGEIVPPTLAELVGNLVRQYSAGLIEPVQRYTLTVNSPISLDPEACGFM